MLMILLSGLLAGPVPAARAYRRGDGAVMLYHLGAGILVQLDSLHLLEIAAETA